MNKRIKKKKEKQKPQTVIEKKKYELYYDCLTGRYFFSDIGRLVYEDPYHYEYKCKRFGIST